MSFENQDQKNRSIRLRTLALAAVGAYLLGSLMESTAEAGTQYEMLHSCVREAHYAADAMARCADQVPTANQLFMAR